ncbi:HlyD family secretion protein [Antarcticirhabdus aurantiaca]|uniref:HlyD family secretion protein n=1 Tax=Antarcticirhabdus aurantiaca TaxID=2606717 RepID=A0ACD4NQ17_9HYPH|nr:HlyD family secretion protein [Antarcticirhabdus aurantiaca]WAJ28817.1 HlyD family secretion protein [Jeongeuplla avenae]
MSDSAAPASATPAATGAPAPKKRRSVIKPILLLAVLAAGGTAGFHYGREYWLDGRFLVSTDDAYVAADMTILSPKISGYVDAVLVSENARVRAGDALVRIDTGDYDLALRQAEAKLDTERAAIASLQAQRKAADAQVGEAEANRQAANATLDQAQLDYGRAASLAKSGAGAKSQLDQATSALQTARAKLAGAEAAIASAKANVGVLDAQVGEARNVLGELELARDKATRDLGFAVLTAPYDGIVGNLAVQPGDFVSAGKRLAAIVPANGVFIDANFKETQLQHIVAGEEVRIEIDALPGRELTGKVVSLSPASGSVFSLLPPDNATGNFTKVVQRVPVRIAVDHGPEMAQLLRPGLSATVAVDTRTAPLPGEAQPQPETPPAASPSEPAGIPVAAR